MWTAFTGSGGIGSRRGVWRARRPPCCASCRAGRTPGAYRLPNGWTGQRGWRSPLQMPRMDVKCCWVGCAGAFEPRAQKTVRAIAELLQRAGVKFTVLGPKERCTGDPARRTGDEFLFQQLAEANVATLNGVGAKTIITQCPHCFHTMKNEYPAFGGEYTVLHHTQFLAQLVEEGRLQLPSNFAESV